MYWVIDVTEQVWLPNSEFWEFQKCIFKEILDFQKSGISQTADFWKYDTLYTTLTNLS